MNTRLVRFLFGTMVTFAIALAALVMPMPTLSAPTPEIFHSEITISTTADEYNVTPNGTCSLREAIKAMNDDTDFGGCVRISVPGIPPNKIFIPSGIYTLTINGAGEDLDASGDLDIRRSVLISSTGALSPTVRGDVDNEVWGDRIFHIITGPVTFNRIIIREGNELGGVGGGAVRVESGQSLTLNDSEVRLSDAFQGGGFYNAGALVLNHVTISGNYNTSCSLSCSGGGIYNTGTITLTDVTLASNSSNFGGGIDLSSGVATLNNVTVISNTAGTYGGGINADYSSTTLTDVTLNGNSAGTYGGGIFNDSGAFTMTNVTISANTAITNGGGIFNGGTGGTALLTNVTLSGNSSATGAGIHTGALAATTLTNTIVANSPSGENCNPSLGGSFNLSDDNTCSFGAGRDSVSVMLGPLTNNGGSTQTHLPKPGSPAINFGTNTGCPSTDQRGALRPIGNLCDVGAVEAAYLFLPLILR